MLSLDEWNSRYQQQAGWTASIRSYLYKKVNLSAAHTILDIGCGTGVLDRELSGQGNKNITSLDISYGTTLYAKSHSSNNQFLTADAYTLPFLENHFDVVICHFLLLWLQDPVMAINEIKRVMKPSGHFLILGEPDHSARVDWPEDFVSLGERQTASLKAQGANIRAGRQVGHWLHMAGLQVEETGVLGGQWNPSLSNQSKTLEWLTIRNDLPDLDNDLLAGIEKKDSETSTSGERILFVPVFYAHGRK